MTHTVRVERNRLRFMSAHMATWEGACEPLHGHNYQLTVEVAGELTPDSWVIDFSLLKRIARERCEQIDHTFLLQRESRVLAIEELDLSERPRNCLKRAQVNTVGELLTKSEDDLLAITNFGQKSLDEVIEKLDERGLSLRGRD